MKRKKQPQTQEEIKQHYNDHIYFLKSAARNFDAGKKPEVRRREARRLAAEIRILVHDTKNSTSILTQLNLKEREFAHSSFGKPDDENLIARTSLLAMVCDPRRPPRYVAPLDTVPAVKVPFNNWWEDAILQDKHGRRLSRKDIVLTMANQDGGVHVDPEIDIPYAELSRANSLGISNDHPDQSGLAHPEEPIVRQIAHELLRSLMPRYKKSLKTKGELLLSLDLQLVREVTSPTDSDSESNQD